MSLSERLLPIVAHARSAPASADFTQRKALLLNFAFLYHVTKASEHLLQSAVEASRGRPDLRYYAFHLEEERGHHLWLAEDLASAGVEVAGLSIPQIAVEMVGSQYYLLWHVDPATLLGYMAVLEGGSPTLAQIDSLEALHGKALLRTARYHAVHDREHSAEITSVLDELAPSSQDIVFQNACQTSEYLRRASQTFVVGNSDG